MDPLHALNSMELNSIVALGNDVTSMKFYLISLSTLWFYDYFLTLGEEIEHAWKGKKTYVFWLYIINRYVCPIFIVVNIVADFAPSFTPDVCHRYAFMEVGGIMILTLTAEAVLTMRLYAITHQTNIILFVAGFIVCWQWIIAIYILTQTIAGGDDVRLLLSDRILANSTWLDLPDIDAYQICLFISILRSSRWVGAWLCISMLFDCLAFIVIAMVTFRASRNRRLLDVMRIFLIDGVIYFFVLFSSNLMWLCLFTYGRPGLRFMHDQPAMIVSSIMINRITLNLKRANKRQCIVWGLKTFEFRAAVDNEQHGTEKEVEDSDHSGEVGSPALESMQFAPGMEEE